MAAGIAAIESLAGALLRLFGRCARDPHPDTDGGPSAAFVRAERGFGIALNPEARTVWLMEGPMLRSYRYGDIRAWRDEASGEGPGRLVVHVRDRERGQWGIRMPDGAERARWMRLLEREINERGSAA